MRIQTHAEEFVRTPAAALTLLIHFLSQGFYQMVSDDAFSKFHKSYFVFQFKLFRVIRFNVMLKMETKQYQILDKKPYCQVNKIHIPALKYTP